MKAKDISQVGGLRFINSTACQNSVSGSLVRIVIVALPKSKQNESKFPSFQMLLFYCLEVATGWIFWSLQEWVASPSHTGEHLRELLPVCQASKAPWLQGTHDRLHCKRTPRTEKDLKNIYCKRYYWRLGYLSNIHQYHQWSSIVPTLQSFGRPSWALIIDLPANCWK